MNDVLKKLQLSKQMDRLRTDVKRLDDRNKNTEKGTKAYKKYLRARNSLIRQYNIAAKKYDRGR